MLSLIAINQVVQLMTLMAMKYVHSSYMVEYLKTHQRPEIINHSQPMHVNADSPEAKNVEN